MFAISANLIAATFAQFRQCGQGCRECQVLWVSPWSSVGTIERVVHPKHKSHAGGFEIDSGWISNFWSELADDASGIRLQVHTHPFEAFHSSIDDKFPIIHKAGFLSLVIPDFGLGPPSFSKAFLTEIQADGTWKEIPIKKRLTIT